MLIRVTRSFQKTNTCSAAFSSSKTVFIHFNIHFSRITLTTKFHTTHAFWHSKYSIAKVANMDDLDSVRNLSYYSNFERWSLNVLELRETIFGLAPVNFVHIEPSTVDESWPRSNKISDVNFTVNSPLVLCILSGVDVKPTGVINLSYHHSILNWQHVNNIPSRPLTNITKVPSMALQLTLQFPSSRYGFPLLPIPVLF